MKAKIIEGRHQLVTDILSKLFDFDNGGMQQTHFQDGNMSEILYNGLEGTPERSLASKPSPPRREVSVVSLQDKSPLILPNIKRIIPEQQKMMSPRTQSKNGRVENPMSIVSSTQNLHQKVNGRQNP